MHRKISLPKQSPKWYNRPNVMLASLTCMQHCVKLPRHADNKVLEAAYNLFIKNLSLLKAWGSCYGPQSAHFCCAFIFILLLTDILAAVDASPSEKEGNILSMSSVCRVLQATKNTNRPCSSPLGQRGLSTEVFTPWTPLWVIFESPPPPHSWHPAMCQGTR